MRTFAKLSSGPCSVAACTSSSSTSPMSHGEGLKQFRSVTCRQEVAALALHAVLPQKQYRRSGIIAAAAELDAFASFPPRLSSS